MLRHLLAFMALGFGSQNPGPVIRTSVKLVQVNVVVHDKHWVPVTDLTRDDFLLTERGKARPISVFSAGSAGDHGNGDAALPPNTFSNRQSRNGGRAPNVTIVLFDRLNTRFEDQAYAKAEIVRFLKNVDPKDRVAIYVLDRKLRVLCDFTDSPEELQRILAGFRSSTGQIAGDTNPPNTGNAAIDEALDESNKVITEAGNLDRARVTLAAFAAIAGHVADVPGRKALVWVSGSLSVSLAPAAGAFNRANVAVYPVDARGLVGMPGARMPSLPAQFYRPGPAPTINFTPDGLQTMQDLAELTGGRAYYNKNDLREALRLALDDATVAYTLGFYPDADSMDGKFHDLKVEVARAGLSVRFRRGYVAAKEEPASEQQSKLNLKMAFESPIESASIPLSAKIERRKGGLNISLSMDVHNLQITEDGAFSNGKINIYFIQQDETGRVLDRAELAYDLHLKKEEYEGYLRNGVKFNRSVGLKEGAKTLRVLSVDRFNAAVGSLIVPLAEVK